MAADASQEIEMARQEYKSDAAVFEELKKNAQYAQSIDSSVHSARRRMWDSAKNLYVVKRHYARLDGSDNPAKSGRSSPDSDISDYLTCSSGSPPAPPGPIAAPEVDELSTSSDMAQQELRAQQEWDNLPCAQPQPKVISSASSGAAKEKGKATKERENLPCLQPQPEVIPSAPTDVEGIVKTRGSFSPLPGSSPTPSFYDMRRWRDEPCFYTVILGRRTGVYRTWSEVEPLVKGFPPECYREFDSEEEALEWYFEMRNLNKVFPVRLPNDTEAEFGSLDASEDLPCLD